jgi:8-oxo-dGTP diphosphatase
VGCFITCTFPDNKKKILIGQRKGSHGPGTWQLPGGHLEMYESFEECAQREVLEETNLSIDNIKFVTATNDPMQSENKHYVTVFVQASIPYEQVGQVKVMEPHKLQGEWEWVTQQELCQRAPLFSPLAHFVKERSFAFIDT